MKNLALIAVFLCLTVTGFSQSIQITDSGRNLIITRGNVTRTLPKVGITTKYNDPYLELNYKYETVFKIADHTIVTEPASSSMEDLLTQLVAMFPEAASGGGGGPGTGSASDLTSGTLSDSRLSSNVTKNNASQVLTNKTISDENNTITINQESVSGLSAALADKVGLSAPATLTNKTIDGNSNTLIVPQSQVTGLSAALASKISTGTLSLINGVNPESGTAITIAPTTSASSLTTGTLPDARLSSNIPTLSSTSTLINKTISGANNTVTNLPQSSVTNLTTDLAAKASLTGIETITGKTISGSSNTISNVPQSAVTGLVSDLAGKATTDASSITSGTLGDGRLSINIPTLTSTSTFTNKSISGATNTLSSIPQSAVTSLVSDLAGKATTSAASLTSGTLADARLSANVPTLTSTSTLTNKTINGNNNTLVVPQSQVTGLSTSLAGKINVGSLGTVNGVSLEGNDVVIPGTNDASTLTAGTLPVGRLPSSVPQVGITNTFTGSNIFAGLTTGTILPATGNTYNIGSAGTRIQSIYANYFMGGSAGAQFGTRTLNSYIGVAQGPSTTDDFIAYAFPTTGNWVFQKNGVAPASDNGSTVTVAGQFRVNGPVLFNTDSLKTFADNAAAVAGGLQPGTLFKSVVGDKWTVEIAHSAATLPIYTSFIATGNTRTLWNGGAFQQQYQAQTSSESWSLNQASNRTAPTFRFEVRNGDTWSGDEPTTADPTGNDSRGRVKERSELYQKTANTPYETDIWVSYAFKLNAGDNFNYTDDNWFCDFGQWHATRSSGGPSWSFDMEDDQMYLRTRGQNGNTTVPLPSLPATLRAQATLTRDVWHYFVVRVRHSKLSTGQIQWWLDGTQICNISGIPLGYDDATAGYWKWGIYRTWHEATVVAEYANMEISQTSLSSGTYNRVTTPLPLTP